MKIDLFSNIPDNFAKARVYPLSCQSFEKTRQNSQQICKNGFHSFLNLFGSTEHWNTGHTLWSFNQEERRDLTTTEMTWPGWEFSIKYWISPHILYKPVNKLSAWLHSGILLLLVIKKQNTSQPMILQHCNTEFAAARFLILFLMKQQWHQLEFYLIYRNLILLRFFRGTNFW